MKNMSEKYKMFTDDEIYVLSRQAIESSWEITMNIEKNYLEKDRRIHNELMNELISERVRRGV